MTGDHEPGQSFDRLGRQSRETTVVLRKWTRLARSAAGNPPPFYPDYMRMKRPRPPRFICGGLLKWALGIISPARLAWHMNGGGTELERRDLAEYIIEALRYRCYKRLLTRGEWYEFYRFVRGKRKYEKLSEEAHRNDRRRNKGEGR